MISDLNNGSLGFRYYLNIANERTVKFFIMHMRILKFLVDYLFGMRF